MIATAQNTKRKLQYKGQTVEVWEALSQAGTRFHLFVTGTQIIGGTPGGLIERRFNDDLADQKIPAAETAKLPDAIE